MDPNVVYCTFGGALMPSPQAVEAQEHVSAVWVRPGSTLGEMVEKIKQHSPFPEGTRFSYVDEGYWCQIHGETVELIVQEGVKYYVRVVVPSRQRNTAPVSSSAKILSLDCLHDSFHWLKHELQLSHISDGAFEKFMHKSCTRDLCKQMMSALIQMQAASSHADNQLGSQLSFLCRFGIALSYEGAQKRDEGVCPGVILRKGTFVSVLTRDLRSTPLRLDEQEHHSLKELGFLFWVAKVLNIKADVDLPQLISLSTDKEQAAYNVWLVSRVAQSASNAVLKVVDDYREMVMKVGHSDETKNQIRQLCVDADFWHQVENEAQFLKQLDGCPLFPSLVFTGYWEDRPVLLSSLEGRPLLTIHNYRPLRGSTVDRLCKDLTEAVLVLHSRGILHCDISTRNVGVYNEPRQDGRCFYLYDFGAAVHVGPDVRKAGAARDLVFSALNSMVGEAQGLMTELTSVAYVCLYMASTEALPWEAAAAQGEYATCCLMRTPDRVTIPESLGECTREWLSFVINYPDDAAVRHDFEWVRGIAANLLNNVDIN
ncbi:hypothetical protein SELMODRAFT_427587 [Selaginella moellendorffii]|uniref:Protein kinase domain-containing protein n=1 Tax=Selaginella moellendorffii TaxID=88036 RepID=D8T030_SELML|nr:hypothetical protein SELMODRAFT_427587 [Selaginella moellendorffii]